MLQTAKGACPFDVQAALYLQPVDRETEREREKRKRDLEGTCLRLCGRIGVLQKFFASGDGRGISGFTVRLHP